MLETQKLKDILAASEEIGSSRTKLEQLVRAGAPHFDISSPGSQRRRLRFDMSELREWLRVRADGRAA